MIMMTGGRALPLNERRSRPRLESATTNRRLVLARSIVLPIGRGAGCAPLPFPLLPLPLGAGGFPLKSVAEPAGALPKGGEAPQDAANGPRGA